MPTPPTAAQPPIAIIGTGPGGLRLAAHLGLAGHRLRLNDIDDSKLGPLRERGGIEVERLDGTSWGFSRVERATTDLRQTVAGAQTIIVVSGGNTHAAVAQALAPLLEDGQLVLLIQGNTGGSLIVRQTLDFSGATQVAVVPNIVSIYPGVPARSVKELIAFAKAKPGGLSYGSAGIGSSQHLAGELFREMAGIDIVHVPYKVASAAKVD